MFNIEFLNYNKLIRKQIYGQIIIGSFTEKFLASLHYWSINDYYSQWLNALNVIFNNDVSASALITSMAKPHPDGFIFCWPLYRIDEIVYLQNRILFLKDIPGHFNVENIGEYIVPRETISEGGEKISEWKSSIDEVKKCISRLSRFSEDSQRDRQ